MRQSQILLVEDDAGMASYITRLLQSWGHGVPAVAASASAALVAVRHHRVDLAFVDIALGREPDGVVIALELHVQHQVPTVFVTVHADDVTLGRAKLAKPIGYIVKPFTPRQLRAATDLALYSIQSERLPHAGVPAPPSPSAEVSPSPLRPSPLAPEPPSSLTSREREILGWLARGATTDAVAAGLGISRSTTKNHVKSILGKLRVHSRLEAVVIALGHGLVQPDDGPSPGTTSAAR